MTTPEQQLVGWAEMVRPRLPYPIVAPASVTIRWDPRWTVTSGVLGAFSWLEPDVVRLAEHARDMPEMMAGIFCHELHHAWQWHIWGPIRYWLACVPGIRQFALERTADIVERVVDDYIHSHTMTDLTARKTTTERKTGR